MWENVVVSEYILVISKRINIFVRESILNCC